MAPELGGGGIAFNLKARRYMMEIQWGAPVALHQPQDGTIEQFSTIEKVRYWLWRKWPVTDAARQTALARIDEAMDCMRPVEDARHAFLVAALSAGFVPARGS